MLLSLPNRLEKAEYTSWPVFEREEVDFSLVIGKLFKLNIY